MNQATANFIGLPVKRVNSYFNWKKIVGNLLGAVGEKRLIKETGIKKGTLRSLQYGDLDEPRNSMAIDLLDLHLDHCESKHNRLSIQNH